VGRRLVRSSSKVAFGDYFTTAAQERRSQPAVLSVQRSIGSLGRYVYPEKYCTEKVAPTQSEPLTNHFFSLLF